MNALFLVLSGHAQFQSNACMNLLTDQPSCASIVCEMAAPDVKVDLSGDGMTIEEHLFAPFAPDFKLSPLPPPPTILACVPGAIAPPSPTHAASSSDSGIELEDGEVSDELASGELEEGELLD